MVAVAVRSIWLRSLELIAWLVLGLAVYRDVWLSAFPELRRTAEKLVDTVSATERICIAPDALTGNSNDNWRVSSSSRERRSGPARGGLPAVGTCEPTNILRKNARDLARSYHDHFGLGAHEQHLTLIFRGDYFAEGRTCFRRRESLQIFRLKSTSVRDRSEQVHSDVGTNETTMLQQVHEHQHVEAQPTLRLHSKWICGFAAAPNRSSRVPRSTSFFSASREHMGWSSCSVCGN